MNALINGINMAYDDNGNGIPILLIHGFPLSRKIWAPQIAALSGNFRLIAPDLAGFGSSAPHDRPYSMELFGDDLIGLLDHLSIAKAVVCGMSMGGYLLLDLLDRYPERVAAACFMVTKGGADDEAGKERRRALAAEVMAKGAVVVAEPFAKILFAPGTEEKNGELFREIREIILGASSAGLAGGLLAMSKRKDYSDALGRFRVPSLVIGAELDKAIPLEESRTLARELPDAKLVIIPGAGHMAGMEQPAAVNRALLNFLKSQPF